MKNQLSKHILSFVGVLFCGVSLNAALFFEDSFDYTGWDSGSRPLSAIWESWQRKPVVDRTEKGGYPDCYITLANGVITTSLPKTLDSSFILTVQLLSTAYGRLHWIGLSDDAGREGYYVAWDTGLATQFGSQGRVAIGKIEVPVSERIGYQRPGPFITKLVLSGHNRSNIQSAATSAPFATLTLKWNSDLKRLTLLVNEAEVAYADDIVIGSLSRIHLAGNSAALFSSVKLQTP